MVRKSYIILLFCASLMQAHAQIKPMKEFVDDLMSRMTLQEKIGQLNLQVAGDITTGSAQNTDVGNKIAAGEMGGIFNLKGVDKIKALQDIAVKKSRLGIPLIVGMDVIHGYETIFPIPLAMSCSWDVDAVEQAARIAAKEASADGINWVYSPMVDICLDARWGRIAESNGEDPYLGSEMAKAYIRGYQGNGYQEADNVMACVKHYALYGAVEGGRDYNTVDMSHLRMYNQYFPPYKAAVEAGAGSIMSSFNLVDGQHATANQWLLTDVLRHQWQFDGFVVTDYGSINEMSHHGFGNQKHNSALALNAGTDMDMCSQGFLKTLQALLQDGSVDEEAINAACRRILEAKYKLGLFQNPYKYLDSSRRATDIYTKEHREAARRMATESFVLLKNDKQVLPLNKTQKVALIGPLADTRNNITGTWSVAQTPERYQTIREAMSHRLGTNLLYAQGSNITRDEALQKAAEFGKTIPRGDEKALRSEALRTAKRADIIVCAMGECADMSGESSSRATLEMPDVQHELLQQLVALGKPVVLLNFSGRPTVLTWEQEHVDAILNVWFGGSEMGEALCDILFGDQCPSGKLTTSMPQAVGQMPLYYNHLNTGRPVDDGTDHYWKYHSNYLEVRNDPLYPFGYGLSYTTFSYSDIRMEGNTATVTVTNTGDRDADEIVQLYIRDIEAAVSRPVKELKGFRRLHLKAGEAQTVAFPITRDMLSYYDGNGNKVFEPGNFDIMVGPNSRDVKTIRLQWNADKPDEYLAQAAHQMQYALTCVKEVREEKQEKNGNIIPCTVNKDGSLKLVSAYDWRSGFFAGSLWMLYEYTRDPKWKKAAEEYTWPLEKLKTHRGTHDLGFMVNNSFGKAWQATGDTRYRDVIIQTARSLCTRYNDTVKCIRSWDFGKDRWRYPVIIDNMMNLEMLFDAWRMTGERRFYDIAVNHANTTMKNHFREDGSSFHVVDYEPNDGSVRGRMTFQGYADDSFWSRGQGWGLYGFTMCYRYTHDERYLNHARKIANFLLSLPNMPANGIPYWDMKDPKQPNIPRDASAAAVIASGLYELSSYVGADESSRYKAFADKITDSLADHYQPATGTSYGFLLLHSTGHLPANNEIDVPLNYADYYYLEALLRRLGKKA